MIEYISLLIRLWRARRECRRLIAERKEIDAANSVVVSALAEIKALRYKLHLLLDYPSSIEQIEELRAEIEELRAILDGDKKPVSYERSYKWNGFEYVAIPKERITIERCHEESAGPQ